jgi:DNA-binding MarR family transcriptional regulator
MSNQSALVDEVIEKFWESIPPVWRDTRAYIRRVAAENFSMTTEQFQVLRRIRKGIDTVSALAEANRTSRSSVSKAVDALVNKGLVSRLVDEKDRRHIHLTLTDEGSRLLEAVFDQAEAWLRNKFQPLPPGELALLLAAMDILQKTFDDSTL